MLLFKLSFDSMIDEPYLNFEWRDVVFGIIRNVPDNASRQFEILREPDMSIRHMKATFVIGLVE